MNKPFALLLLPALAACTMLSPASAAPARQHLLLDADWRFQQLAPMTLRNAAPITAWRWRPGQSDEAAAMTAVTLDTTGGDWQEDAAKQDVFRGKNGFAWFRTTLPTLTAAQGRTLHFEAVDDNATVYLNGQKLTHHEGWNDPFDVPLDVAWNAAGPNVVVVLVENTAGGGGITAPVTLGVSAVPGGSDLSKPEMSDASWRTVHLPHDYVLESAFTPQGDASHGSLIPTPAWYRKTFTLPASDKGKALWLNFDGVYRDSKIYLNGQEVGEHACGYTPFNLDISQAAHYGGKNVLAVQVNPQHEEGWWYEGGGIYRHVWLNIADPVHIAPWGTFVSTKMAEPGPDGSVTPATVTIKTTIANSQATDQITYRVFDPSGKAVGNAAAALTGQPNEMAQVAVSQPLLWSLETPRLYRLHTEIKQGGKVVDATDTSFGIRTIRFDAEKGFFLNGLPVKIKGTCNHQDFAGVGVAMPDSLLYWRIKKLKEMGSNAYRMSHNPPTAELLDACDKLGMLVMDENRHLGDTENGKASLNTPYADLHEVQSMVLRDRNHPSIIMWSMCNEEGIQSTKEGARIFAAMKKAVDDVDGTRPVTCAMNGGYDSAVGITSVEDLQGINYNPGAYDGFHKAHPTMPLYGSETASTVSTRGVYTTTKFGGRYEGEESKGYVAAYDVNAPPWAQTAEDAWQPIADRPFVAGGYVWTGFDYKGEPTPFNWPDINSNFGILDECGFPKDLFYYYQSVWGDKPIVHVLPHWNWAGKEGQPIDVWAFSNAARVELFLNGASLGAKEMPKNGHLAWSVPYAPGTLEAKGYGSDGKTIAMDKVETTGAPAALRLSTDRTKLTADGEDLTMVEVDVVDSQGRVVPTADNFVSFEVSGAGHVAGVGNGNPSSHEPDKAAYRHAFNGKCLVIVGAGENAGDIHLTASAFGLKGAELEMTAGK
jgi:beta-galactosidase